MKLGEMWWAYLPRLAGWRPVLLLSRDGAYPVQDFISVSPLTTRRRGLRTEVDLGPEDGLPRLSVANVDVIITESTACLRERIGSIRAAQLRAVDEAIHFALGLEQ